MTERKRQRITGRTTAADTRSGRPSARKDGTRARKRTPAAEDVQSGVEVASDGAPLARGEETAPGGFAEPEAPALAGTPEAGKKTAAAAHFDCPDIYEAHAFLVRLGRGKEATARVLEVFGRPPAANEPEFAPEALVRCEVPRAVWDAVAAEAKAEFNRRLRAEGKRAGRWGAEETALRRLFGKELLVLLWAVETPEVTQEEIGTAVRNWLGLKPEERWWLYTMTAAATGHAHQAGLGWRGALRLALTFGTRADAFALTAVPSREKLAPRRVVAAGRGAAKQKRRKQEAADETPDLLAPLFAGFGDAAE